MNLPKKIRIRVLWGGFSLIKAELQLLKAASNCGFDIDFFYLISGLDYPIVSNEFFDNYFKKIEGKSFLYYGKEKDAANWRKGKYPKRVCPNVLDWLFSYYDEYSSIEKNFHYTLCCDELFSQTIFQSLIEKLHIGTSLSMCFIELYPKRSTKKLSLVLDYRDYDDIISSGMLFCRNVSLSQSGELLNRLDAFAISQEA